MAAPAPPLPAQGRLSPLVQASEAAALAVAATLVVCHVFRLDAAHALAAWWTPVVLAATLVAADFLTGCVHWAADTWGREDLPIVGPRLIRPFRVHHVNPDDLIGRSFIDANGDVALLATPVLAAAFLVPLEHTGGRVAALALVSLAVWVLPTNQVHQWAHQPAAPIVVRWLQGRRLLLSPAAHGHHHTAPYVANYCILTGWCNAPLAAIGFFPAMERLVTALTGARPREEDATYGRQ
jgi:ubiquitin-conjugating enzyme E2 variant